MERTRATSPEAGAHAPAAPVLATPRGAPAALLATALLVASAALAAGCSDKSAGGFAVGADLAVAVTPNPVNFGAVALDAEADKAVTIRHTGTTGDLVLSRVALVTTSPDLAMTGPAALTLAPGEETTLTLRYTPSDAQVDEGQVVIETNVATPDGGALTVVVEVIALQQLVSLVPQPSTLNLGPVATGAAGVAPVTFRSVGGLPVTVTSIGTDAASSPDFAVTGGAAVGAVVAPGERFEVEVTYAPAGFDSDLGRLVVGYDALSGPGEVTVNLAGNEVTARLAHAPDPLDFGLRVPGQAATAALTLSNAGTFPLEIGGAEVVGAGTWGFTVRVEPPAEPVILPPAAPGEAAATWDLLVTWTPPEEMVPTNQPLAYVRVLSNDPEGGGEHLIPVFGGPLTAGLAVYPGDVLYFGYVHVGATVRRDLTLYNGGYKPIEISRIWAEGAFALAEPDAWGPTMLDAQPATLASGEQVTVPVSFTNDDPAPWATKWGKVTIESDDAMKPTWEVLTQARYAGEADCWVQLVPDTADLGFVRAGSQGHMTVDLVNVGSKDCGFAGAAIGDCDAHNQCPPAVFEGPFETTSVRWSLLNVPEEAADNLKAGQSLPIEVAFDAPPMPPDQRTEILNWAALMRVHVTSLDPSGATVTTELPYIPAWAPQANLLAHSAEGALLVAPLAHDYGLVPVGCRSEPLVVTATNIGPAPVGITDVRLDGCGPEVRIDSYPPLADPWEDGSLVARVDPTAVVEILVSYAPQDEVDDACALLIESTDTDIPAVVSLGGQGSTNGLWTDTFADSDPQVVDVLFVVDDSGSMGQEQDNLATSFGAFIKTAAKWKSDYQIGVTTTDVEFPNGGKLKGDPTFVTSKNWEKFLATMMVGTTGSGTEQGLWAAQIAVVAPLTDTTTDACDDDYDCGFFHECREGYCGGRNRGFIRPGAALELVFVSDEEDQSPDKLDDYLNFFRKLKGFDRPDLLHVHAIVGPPGGCSSVNGQAEAGHRYMDLADDTGGVSASICELDFSKALEDIGEIAFAAQQRYYLSHTPAPTTLDVRIDGVPCPPMTGGLYNWTYDALANRVQLEEGGICKAAPGDLVAITYELLCFSDANQ